METKPIKKKTAKKFKKEDHVLIADFKTTDKDYKKSEKISLTEEGRQYLKSIHKIN